MESLPLVYLIPAALGLGILLAFIGLAQVMTQPAQQIDTRLQTYGTRAGTFVTGDEVIPVYGEAEEKGNALARWLERRTARNQDNLNSLRNELARADLKLRVGEWQMFQLLTVAIMGVLGFFIFGNPFLAVLFGILGFFLPRFYLRMRQGRRLAAFNKLLPDSIAMTSNSLRAGYSFLQSLDVLANEMPDPIAAEFNRVVREVGLGLTQSQALANLYRRVPSSDLDMMITAINVQQEIGGNLAEILDTLAYTIRERVRIQGEIRILVAQQMLSGNVITFLPVALAVVLFVLNRDYMAQLYETQCGWLMIGTSVLMVVLGYFAIQRIIAIEV